MSGSLPTIALLVTAALLTFYICIKPDGPMLLLAAFVPMLAFPAFVFALWVLGVGK